jgi:hypothetical protein
MNCAEAKMILPGLAGGDATGARAEEARAHANTCESCGVLWADLEATVALCRRAGAEPLPDGFAAELHAQLLAAGPPPASMLNRVRRVLAARPLASMAAAMALAACLAIGVTLRVTRTAPATAGDTHRVPQSKIALVKVDFVADAPVDDVAFEVLLPDGLRFYSRGEALPEHSFQWHGKLVAGSNPIPIAVKGERPGTYHVIAHATGPDLDVVQDVIIEVTS